MDEEGGRLVGWHGERRRLHYWHSMMARGKRKNDIRRGEGERDGEISSSTDIEEQRRRCGPSPPGPPRRTRGREEERGHRSFSPFNGTAAATLIFMPQREGRTTANTALCKGLPPLQTVHTYIHT